MAEVKNAFIQSKMNKDLDSRLVPNGEYRNAINAQISRSEGSDVGALENALGNSVQATFEDGQSYSNNLTCIGYVTDETSNCIYVFLTDGTRVGGDAFVSTGIGSNHFIYKYNTNSPSPPVKIVSGAFLNFSKNYPIYGINLLENLLFWTDNFNQPRKINVATASNPENANVYYTTEDQISVASYNPYQPIELYQQIDSDRVDDNPLLTPALNEYDTTMRDVVSKFYPGGGTANVVTGVTNSPTVDIDQINIPFFPTKQSASTVKTPQNLMTVGVIAASTSGNGPIVNSTALVTSYSGTTLTLDQNITVGTSDTLVFNFNPYYDSSYAGDSRFLEDKFVRFSYRFKFDDGEYSIYAPFTQPCFIPKQDGYFLNTEQDLGDQQSTYASTVVEFMKNKVSEITLRVPLPSAANTLMSQYLVKEIDILFKESDGLAVQIVETVPASRISALSGSDTYYDYKYINKKPFKTLPESELIRVFDKVPVKALSQETASNRIIYGNFQNKHTPPVALDYRVSVGEKKAFDLDPTYSVLDTTSIIEYPSSSVKTNRTYQVGVVLSDKFGRQSSVILSNNKNVINTGGLSFSGDTVYSPYIDGSNISGEFYEWLGNSLKMSFNSVIGPNRPNTNTYEPGIYNGDVNDTGYNPLGWYSYKIVVKQQEQEYYNVYTAGAMKDIPYNYSSIVKGPPTPTDPITPNISFVTLLNDNINKVPRDLTEVGPQDKTFRSSVVLFGRVENTTHTYSNTGNKQFQPDRTSFTTNSIEDLFDLFDVEQFENNVDVQVPVTDIESPFSPFFKADANPFVGEFVTSQDASKQFGVLNEVVNTNTYTANGSGAQSQPSPTIPLTSFSPGFTLEPGYKVTGGIIVDDVFVVSYDPAASEVVISEAITYISGTTFTFTQEDYLPIENLAILETAPTVSNLDIYWETSSAGLISELNEAIRNSANSTEADIAPFNDSAFEEDLSVGEDILSSDFVVIDVGGFGAPVDPNLVTLTTESITYTGNESRDASEILEVYKTATPGAWNIRTKQGFVDNIWYSEDPNNRNFIINLSVSVENKGSADVNGAVTNSTDVLIDNLTTNFIPAVGARVTGVGIPSGVEVVSYSSILSQLVLDTSVSLPSNTALTIENGQPSVTKITKTVELDNQPPDIFDGYNPQGSIILSSSVIDLTTIPFKDGYVMKSLSGVNGANTPNAGQQVDFRIVDVIGSNNGSFLNNFNIIKNENESTGSLVAVDLVLSSIIGLNIDYTYQAVVNLKDAGGEESSIAFDFKFGTKPSRIKTRDFFEIVDRVSGKRKYTTYTVITITDQPVSNNSNGIYYFRGSPASLQSIADNNVITIDRANAAVFGVGCDSRGSRSNWAFASGSSSSAEWDALNIASECLANPNDGHTQLRNTDELTDYSFQVV
jgi:hypothetical protein